MFARITEVTNPFNPNLDRIDSDVKTSVSINDWLLNKYGSTDFSHPTICLVNGDALLRSDWSYRIKDNDVINFIRLAPGEPLTVLAIVLSVVSIAATVYYMNGIPKPNDGKVPNKDPVYTLLGQANSIKLMSPIEVPYGRIRIWPSYAARSYNKFDDDDQILYSLFALGQGSYQIEKMQVEDTALSAFKDIEYEIVEPNGTVTLFPNNVITSVEVASLDLFPPNDKTNYPVGGWIGPYVVNPAGSEINRIEVDVAFPSGLFGTDSKGRIQGETVTTEFYYRRVDLQGNPIGEWLLLARDSRKLATINAKRFTLGVDVPPGRFEVRARRTNDGAVNDPTKSDKAQWVFLRGFLPDTRDYGDITLLALKARASNNLNDNAANRFNLVVTRKLPVWHPVNGWSEPVPTRSIVWAFCDVFRATYGGKLADSFLDLPHLFELDIYYSEKGYFFDWVFEQKSTVWDAASTIARAGRAVPMLTGSRITMVMDEPKSIPVAMFNQDNIIKDSFRWDIRLFEMNALDSVELEYTDPQTWNPEEVFCSLPNSEGVDPEKIKLSGCTNRDQAFREGMYITSCNFYNRENISFSTGLEGYIPTYGDLISVSHDLPRWGQAGVIFNKNGRFLELSEPVTFSQTLPNFIALRKKDGSAAGPFKVLPTSDEFIVELAQDIDTELYFDGIREYPLFQFGVAEQWAKLCKVVSITPSTGETIEITCTNYDARVFAYDDSRAPPLASRAPTASPDLPVVLGLSVRAIPDTTQNVLVDWNAALGANAYILQQSTDGVVWDNVARLTTTSYTLPIIKGYLYIRVAGVNIGAGDWTYWQGAVGEETSPPTPVTGFSLQSPFTGTYVKLQWNSVVNATGYTIEVLRSSDETILRTVNIVGQTFTYSAENAAEDNAASRDFIFKASAYNALGVSDTPAIVITSNPRPAKITNVMVDFIGEDETGGRIYDLSWSAIDDVDLKAYRVWGSLVKGFTPSGETLIHDGLAVGARITNTGSSPMYFRVAAADVWNDTVNISDEYIIP